MLQSHNVCPSVSVQHGRELVALVEYFPLMSGFDDAADRRLHEIQQAAKKSSEQAFSTRDIRSGAAEDLANRLRELANYLSTRVRPTSVEVRPKPKWSKPGLWSPEGYVLSYNKQTLLDKTTWLTQLLMLTTDGRLWEYSQHRKRQDFIEIDFHDPYVSSGRTFLIAGTTFSEEQGRLRATEGRDPARPVDPTEALANLAAHIIAGTYTPTFENRQR